MDFPVLMISEKRRARCVGVPAIEELRRRAWVRRARGRAWARGGRATRTETSKRADQYKAGLRVAHSSVQQLLAVVCGSIHINLRGDGQRWCADVERVHSAALSE